MSLSSPNEALPNSASFRYHFLNIATHLSTSGTCYLLQWQGQVRMRPETYIHTRNNWKGNELMGEQIILKCDKVLEYRQCQPMKDVNFLSHR